MPKYVFAFRDPQSRSALAAEFGRKTVDARDFERSVPDTFGLDGALVLDRLNMLILEADPADVAAIAARPPFAERVVAYRQGRQIPAVSKTTKAKTSLFDESTTTWGLQVTGVAGSKFTGRGVRVAVLDIALDDQHPDFSSRPATTWHSLNGLSPNRSKWLHGTAVCGIVAGPLTPKTGPRYGVAPDCELFFGRVGNEKFSYDDPTVLAGINWALTNNCRVANLSLGIGVKVGDASDPLFDKACSDAADQGLLIVAAGGNNSDRNKGNISPVDEPANSPMALAVGAITPSKGIARFSPRGCNGNGGEVNLVGPGVAVRSARANATTRDSLYANFSLTSYATPFVTGIAALWLEKQPDLSTSDLWARLQSTAVTLGDSSDFGHGLVQAP